MNVELIGDQSCLDYIKYGNYLFTSYELFTDSPNPTLYLIDLGYKPDDKLGIPFKYELDPKNKYLLNFGLLDILRDYECITTILEWYELEEHLGFEPGSCDIVVLDRLFERYLNSSINECKIVWLKYYLNDNKIYKIRNGCSTIVIDTDKYVNCLVNQLVLEKWFNNSKLLEKTNTNSSEIKKMFDSVGKYDSMYEYDFIHIVDKQTYETKIESRYNIEFSNEDPSLERWIISYESNIEDILNTNVFVCVNDNLYYFSKFEHFNKLLEEIGDPYQLLYQTSPSSLYDVYKM